jgi:hypothetical protein
VVKSGEELRIEKIESEKNAANILFAVKMQILQNIFK